MPSPFFLRPAAARLDGDPRLQRIFEQICPCRPRPLGHLVAQILDDLGIGPEQLDRLLCRRCDPDLAHAVGADPWPPPPLDPVPGGAR